MTRWRDQHRGLVVAVTLWLVLLALACWALGDAWGLLPGQAGAARSLDWWQQQHGALLAWQAAQPLAFLFGFLLLFTLLSALALPGCAPLALLAGTAFGVLGGTLVVGLASTVGATLSFLVARHAARAPLQRRLGHRLAWLDSAARRDGPLWLFWLRLVPLVPYPVINPLLGLSHLPLAGFFWPSLAGLTLGSVPYVWAGTSLARLLEGDAPDWWLLAAAAGLLVATAAVARHRLQRAGAA